MTPDREAALFDLLRETRDAVARVHDSLAATREEVVGLRVSVDAHETLDQTRHGGVEVEFDTLKKWRREVEDGLRAAAAAKHDAEVTSVRSALAAEKADALLAKQDARVRSASARDKIWGAVLLVIGAALSLVAGGVAHALGIR